jgi:Na+/melibiose symporter-like transporter
MLQELVLAAQSQPEAAGFILRGIKGVFVTIGSIVAAIVCAVIAAMKGRNPLGWGILGLFFSILTLIAVAIIPSKK